MFVMRVKWLGKYGSVEFAEIAILISLSWPQQRALIRAKTSLARSKQF